MKKILLMVIALMTLVPMADAQIKKTGETKTETISSLRTGVVSLKLSKGMYYLTLRTTKQFDDPMILKLGDSKESAIQSLNDLIDILDSLQGNATQYIDNGFGKEFRLFKMMGALYIDADGYAGNGNISKGELNKLIKALSK
jgi:hypothetical protein